MLWPSPDCLQHCVHTPLWMSLQTGDYAHTMNLHGFCKTTFSIPKNGSCPREGKSGILALGLQQSFFIPLLPGLTYLYSSLDEEHPEVPSIPTVPSTQRHS